MWQDYPNKPPSHSDPIMMLSWHHHDSDYNLGSNQPRPRDHVIVGVALVAREKWEWPASEWLV